MTPIASSPVVDLPAHLATVLAEREIELGSLESAEKLALARRLVPTDLNLPGWTRFSDQIVSRWKAFDHVLVRGLLTAESGIAVILLALAFGCTFKPYRRDKIVKRFTMSPWTRALSHTLAEGHFHTDLNTAPTPPTTTAIQCVHPDPDTPQAGEVRVARLNDLLDALQRMGGDATLRFLHSVPVSMVNDSDPVHWRGHIIENGTIRFHPETLRAGQVRCGDNPPDMEARLDEVKLAALEVSTPIHFDPGDVLVVSNRRALHYRGACTVRFREFPRDFESRSVHVLHLMDEPA